MELGAGTLTKCSNPADFMLTEILVWLSGDISVSESDINAYHEHMCHMYFTCREHMCHMHFLLNIYHALKIVGEYYDKVCDFCYAAFV